jgi:hypothetical protein
MWLYEMPKAKDTTRTTLVINTKLWKQFLSFVVQKHGTARRISVEVEEAIKEYLDNQEKPK